jgi:hypothetical protein
LTRICVRRGGEFESGIEARCDLWRVVSALSAHQKEDMAVTLRELADSLIRETQDMRWQDARDTLEAALGEQYRLGFLDGNAKCCAAYGHSPGDHEGAEEVTGACV